MPEHVQYEDDDLFNPETAHEHSDVPVRPLIWSIILFVILSVLTHFAIKFMYDSFSDLESKRMDPPQTTVALPEDVYVPKNQPLLQPFPRRSAEGLDVPPNSNTPVVDLVDMRAAEEKVLHNYGWVDKQHGVVHIPIEEAKKRFVASQSGPPAAATTTTGRQP